MSNKEKTYQIRYNTHSTSDKDSWRLICGDEEILVSNIIIKSKVITTKDFIEELGWKYHVTCIGVLKVKDGVAYINEVDNSTKRHILKTISYRVLGTSITVIGAYCFGLSIQMSSLLGMSELLIKPLIYFLHERLWFKFIKIK
jgi:uncharacterized membrane protein